MSTSLAGAWTLRKNGSDHVPGIESINSIPLSAKLRGDFKGERLLISQLTSGPIEEVHITLRSKSGYSPNYYQLGKLNYEGKKILSVITGIDKEFKELCITRLGPARGQRSVEHYAIDQVRQEVRLEIDIDSPESGKIRMVKYLIRSVDTSDVKIPPKIKFHNTQAINNWLKPESHSAAVLQLVSVDLNGTLVRYINTRSGNSVNVENESTNFSKSIETKRFEGKSNNEEKVTYFVIKVLHIYYF